MIFIGLVEAPMAIRVDLSISLRSEYGVTIGRLLKVSDKQLLLEADTKFKPGSKIEFQLELASYAATVYGLAQVTRVTAYNDAPNRYLLAIGQLATKDRKLYKRWLYELAQGGGSTAQSSAAVSSIISTTFQREPPRSAPPPAASRPPVRRGPDVAWSAASSHSTSRQHVGRAAVREALRARFAGRGRITTPARDSIPPEPTSEPVGRYGMDSSTISQAHGASPKPAPPAAKPVRSADAEAEFSSKIHRARGRTSRTAGGGDITITHSPEAERQFSSRQQTPPPSSSMAAMPGAQAPRPKRVEITLALDKRPPLVSLRYRDVNRFLSDYSDYLSKNAAFVRWSGTKPGHKSEVAVELLLPAGARIVCKGQVVAIMPSGFGLSLKLSDSDRERIREEARVGG
jgi:hypothetical protein